MLARRLANLGAAAMIAIGVGGIVYPKESARGYGIPADDDAGATYVRAAALRDVALGLILLRASLQGKKKALRTVLACTALVAGGDTLVVGALTRDPAKMAIHAIGLSGIAVVWLLAAFGEC
jgi:hypothetical protein